jgi:hypothetical protein
MIPYPSLINKLQPFMDFYDYEDITGYYVKKKMERLRQFSLGDHELPPKMKQIRGFIFL